VYKRQIVTARADAAPEAIAALWTDGLLNRIDIEAPGGATTNPSEPAEVDEFLAELPVPARAVLDYLAVAEPLSMADLAVLAGDGAVTEAEDWGGAETRVRSGRADDAVVYTAHPLFAQRALAALGGQGGTGARRRRTELVTQLSQHPLDLSLIHIYRSSPWKVFLPKSWVGSISTPSRATPAATARSAAPVT